MELMELLVKGMYDEFFQRIHGEEKPPKLIKAYGLRLVGKYSESLEELSNIQEHENPFEYVQKLILDASNYWSLADYEMCEKLLDLAYSRIGSGKWTETENRYLNSKYYRARAILHGIRGKIMDAVRLSKLALQNCDVATVEGRADFVIISNNLAYAYIHQGEYNKAKDIVDSAIEHTSQLGKSIYLGYLFNNMGLVNYYFNDLQKAEEAFERALSYWDEPKNSRELSSAYFNLIQLYLKRDKKTQAKEYLDKLLCLDNSMVIPIITIRQKISRAIYHKSHPMLTEKFKALPILQDFVRNNDVEETIRIFGLKHLCELLLYELQAADDPAARDEIVAEIKEYLSEIIRIAERQNLNYTYAETRLLMSKLEMILGNIEKANLILQKLKETFEDRGITELVVKEIKFLNSLVIKWKDMVLKNEDITKLIKETEILDYLKEVQRIVT